MLTSKQQQKMHRLVELMNEGLSPLRAMVRFQQERRVDQEIEEELEHQAQIEEMQQEPTEEE